MYNKKNGELYNDRRKGQDIDEIGRAVLECPLCEEKGFRLHAETSNYYDTDCKGFNSYNVDGDCDRCGHSDRINVSMRDFEINPKGHGLK
jgi:hypothetical protein